MAQKQHSFADLCTFSHSPDHYSSDYVPCLKPHQNTQDSNCTAVQSEIIVQLIENKKDLSSHRFCGKLSP